MINIGVIGYGYWGPNLVRNFLRLSDSTVIAVCDQNESRLDVVRSSYGAMKTTADYSDLLTDNSVDAIVIATPVSTHFDLAMQALKAGKHVLVEKPMTETVEQGKQLIEESKRCNKILMVDHTFVYTGAVSKIKELLDDLAIGDIYYYDSVRVNLGLFQHDVNVLWDLAIHDLSIMDYVLNIRPCAVSATGIAHISGQPENVAYLTCYFDDNLIAHIHVNWLAPVKVRHTLIGGAQKMIVYNDLEPSEKIKVYNKGVTLNDDPEGRYQQLIGYRSGDMWAPHLDTNEALFVEASHFVECIQQCRVPLTNGMVGLRLIQILEAASKSIQQRGIPIGLDLKEG